MQIEEHKGRSLIWASVKPGKLEDRTVIVKKVMGSGKDEKHMPELIWGEILNQNQQKL